MHQKYELDFNILFLHVSAKEGNVNVDFSNR